MLVVNIINISSRIDMKMKFSSQRKEMLLFGRHDITCKPAINCKHCLVVCTEKTKLGPATVQYKVFDCFIDMYICLFSSPQGIMAPYIPTAEVGMKLALTGTVIITVKLSVKN